MLKTNWPTERREGDGESTRTHDTVRRRALEEEEEEEEEVEEESTTMVLEKNWACMEKTGKKI